VTKLIGSSLVARRLGVPALAFLTYACLSFAFVGWRLIHHPGRDLVGYNTQIDPELFLWSFAWWPHAIAAWTNPFVTHAIYAPVGIDLVWVTSVPLMAIVFSPVTAVFGPSVAYNVAAILLPALSAWTGFLLCRYLTRSWWASWCGGYLFGFSSFMLGHEYGGDLNLTGSFLVPLMALVLLKHIHGELPGKGLAWRLGLLLGLELWISTEIVVTVALALLLAIPLGLALLPDYRKRLAGSVIPTTGAFALAVLIGAPLLYYAWVGSHPSGYGIGPAADLMNIVVPSRLTEFGGSTFAHTSSSFTPLNDFERGSYIGLPVLAILVLLGIRQRRSSGVRYVLVLLTLALVLALGDALYVRGKREIAMPWRLVEHLPVLENLQPQRFMLFGSLAAAVAVAVWIATTKGRVFSHPYVLPACAVVSLFPAVTAVNWTGRPTRSAFFTQRLYERCIPKGETVAIFPFGRWGDSMLWQAESGFRFTMAEGNMGRDNYPPQFVFDPIVSKLQFQVTNTVHLPEGELRSFATTHHVERIVSMAGGYPDHDDLSRLGSVSSVGGVLVAPACDQPALGNQPS
jgi:hypothetical protein